MFGDFFKRRRAQNVARKWHESTLGLILASHTSEYMNSPALAVLDDEGKKGLVENFYQQVFEVREAENPFLAQREKLAAYVLSFTQVQVLCLTAAKKAAAFYANCPYISGELCGVIDRAVPHVEELRELNWAHSDLDNEGFVSFCNTRCLVYGYYLNGFNLVRTEFGDCDDTKDWFRPFVQSMLIWQEHTIRGKMGLPDLLSEPLDGLKHSIFMNMVLNGFRNPWYEWEKSWTHEGDSKRDS